MAEQAESTSPNNLSGVLRAATRAEGRPGVGAGVGLGWAEYAPILVAILLLLVAAAIAAQTLAAANRLTGNLDSADASMASVGQFLASAMDEDSALRVYVETGEVRYLEAYRQGRGAVLAALNALKSPPSEPDASSLRSLESMILEKHRISDQIVSAREQQDLAAANALAARNRDKLSTAPIRDALAGIADGKRARVVSVLDDLRRFRLRAIQRALIGASILLVLLSAECISIRTSARRIRGLRSTVSAAEQRYRLLSGRLQQEREATATAVSRALHDQLMQPLVAIKLDATRAARLVATEPGEAVGILRGIQGTADAAVRTSGNIAGELRPAILDLAGIAAALEWHIAELRSRTSLQLELRAGPDIPPLGPEQQTVMFRLAQEALANIVQHAHAGRVTVTLERQSDTVVLVIDDDGVGIPREKLEDAHSLGLAAMQESADTIGADLAIGPGPDGGTRVRLGVPFLPVTA